MYNRKFIESKCMKQLFTIGFFTIFFSFFACGFLSGETIVAAPRFEEKQLGNKSNTKEKVPILIELFTAEGCPMCPPADKNLVYLEREQPFPEAEIITLSLHVDYWNSRGWKDEFSSPMFTRRQDIYAQIFRVREIYTPQMVIDGRTQLPGADLAKTRQAITENAKQLKGKIEITSTKDAASDIKLHVNISDLPVHENSTVFLAIAEDNLASKRGKSASTQREYVSVVRELKSLGPLNAAQNRLETEIALQFQPAWKKESLKFIVFVQENANRKILAVNKIKLPEGKS